MKRLLMIVTSLILPVVGFSQDNLEKFRNQVDTYYHYIKQPDVKNFSCQLSSDFYINFIKDKGDSSHFYPLKFIWTGEQRFYVRKPLPTQLSDSLRREALTRMQELKNIFSGILLDLEKFLIYSPLEEIPSDASVKFMEDTVGVRFELNEDGQQINIRQTFTRGGQLGRVVWRAQNQKIVNYPLYDERDNKWICMGWDSQIYENERISSGMAVRIDYNQEAGRYLPTRLNSVIQARQKTDTSKVVTRGYNLYLKDYIFNENLEIIQSSNSKELQPPQ